MTPKHSGETAVVLAETAFFLWAADFHHVRSSTQPSFRLLRFCLCMGPAATLPLPPVPLLKKGPPLPPMELSDCSSTRCFNGSV